MYYEINVAKNGIHLFATAERSAQSMWNAKTLYEEIKSKFPEEEGYSISITKWEKVGHFINNKALPWEE